MRGYQGGIDSLLLMALGIGYLVLYFAKREDKMMKLAGYFVGAVIILLTTVTILFNYWAQSQMCSRLRYYEGKMKQRMMQPSGMPQMPARK